MSQIHHKKFIFLIISSFLLSVLVSGLIFLIIFFKTDLQAPLPDGCLFWNNQVYHEEIFLINQGQIWLEWQWFKEHIGETAEVKSVSSNAVIIPAEDIHLDFSSGKVKEMVARHLKTLEMPLIHRYDRLWIQFKPLNRLYRLQYSFNRELTNVIMMKTGQSVRMGYLIIDEKLRKKPDENSRYYRYYPEGSEFILIERKDDWQRVIDSEGIIGYIPASSIRYGSWTRILDSFSVERKNVPLKKPVNLTWEFYSKPDRKLQHIPEMKSLSVVSPTWFDLDDYKGNLSSDADFAYIEWAEKRDYQIWGLFANGFNRRKTRYALRNDKYRKKMIAQILAYSSLYRFHGVNIDFENMFYLEKRYFVEFLKELDEYIEAENLLLSVDVSVLSSSPNWSLCYDRRKIGEIADYVALMAYDEHWSTSPVPGPVASIPWTEKAVRGLLKYVPEEKILLGIPFYSRIWRTYPYGYRTRTKSAAFGMRSISNWIKTNQVQIGIDSENGVHYGQFEHDRTNYQVWVEDGYSIRQRLEIAEKYNLAGIASWRRGLETDDIWKNVIDPFMLIRQKEGAFLSGQEKSEPQ